MTYDVAIPGFLSEAALELIEAEVLHLPPNAVMLEIGASLGRVTYCLAATAPQGKVYAVDLWQPRLTRDDIRKAGVGFDKLSAAEAALTLENFQRWVKLANVVTVPSVVTDRFDGIPDDSVDLVFIDGNPNPPFLSDDLWFYARKLKSSGVMMGSFKSAPNLVKNELRAFAKAVGGELVFTPHDIWRLTNFSVDAILAKRYVVQGYKFKWYKEEHTPEDEHYIETLRAEAAEFAQHKSPEAEFISKALNGGAPATYIDLGCWGGVLAEKVIAGGNVKASFLLDTSVSLTAIAAERNPSATAIAATIVATPDEQPVICAERGRSLYATSPLKRYAQGLDLIQLKIGPTMTAEELFAMLLPKLEPGPVFIKADINCYEHLIVEELLKHDIDVVGLHVKVQTIRKRETLRALEQAAEKFGLIKPHKLLQTLSSEVYSTVSLTRIKGWFDIRDHKSSSLASGEYLNSFT